jgi:ABC-2 type transport system ATP-binding protein
MIDVQRLSKRYGTVLAVDRISFKVGKGEIVGLLGPNGAGKTTTMRILTTFLAPTSGQASIAGFDVLDQPLDVRRSVGYLPENVPLYPEMRVREFLTFRAKLKDVSRAKRNAVIDGVIESTRIKDMENRILGHLSKGYRQRVGLAESMLHDPDVLILDEPTAGLDPIQIREVRSLIKELGERHTILLSTHIMSEVEAVCGRVIIIARGRIAVDDELNRIQADRAIVLEARGPADAIRNALQSAPGVERVAPRAADAGYAAFEVYAKNGTDLREALAQRVLHNGWPLRRLDLKHATLEDRFVQAVAREATTEAAEHEAV